jgi:transcriptional regulator with XRE-family HTH domain
MNSGQLATKAGLSRVTISKYETGKALPGALELVRLARALGVGVERLLGGNETAGGIQAVSRPSVRVSPTGVPAIGTVDDLALHVTAAVEHLLRVEELAGYRPNNVLEEIRRGMLASRGATALGQAAEMLRQRPGMGLGNLACARVAEAAGATCAFVAPGFGIPDALAVLMGDRPFLLIREPDHQPGCVEDAVAGVFRELAHLILHPRHFTAPGAPSQGNWLQQPAIIHREARFFGDCLALPGQSLRQLWEEEGLGQLEPEKSVPLLQGLFHCRASTVLRRLRQEHLASANGPANLSLRRLRRKIRLPQDHPGDRQPEQAPSTGHLPRPETCPTSPSLLETSCRADRLLAVACRRDPAILAEVTALGYGPQRVSYLFHEWPAGPRKEVTPQDAD